MRFANSSPAPWERAEIVGLAQPHFDNRTMRLARASCAAASCRKGRYRLP